VGKLEAKPCTTLTGWIDKTKGQHGIKRNRDEFVKTVLKSAKLLFIPFF
jgi:hypothetical protein